MADRLTEERIREIVRDEIEEALLKEGGVYDGCREVTFNMLRQLGLIPMRDAARSLAPVDDGQLRDSIGIAPTLIKSARSKAPKGGDDTTTRVTAYVGTANRNGVPREFGSIRSAAQWRRQDQHRKRTRSRRHGNRGGRQGPRAGALPRRN